MDTLDFVSSDQIGRSQQVQMVGVDRRNRSMMIAAHLSNVSYRRVHCAHVITEWRLSSQSKQCRAPTRLGAVSLGARYSIPASGRVVHMPKSLTPYFHAAAIWSRAWISAARTHSQAQLSDRRADSLIMSVIEQAEGLRQEAIRLLLAEQELLGDKLLQLGYDQESSPVGKRRGKRSKLAPERDATVTDALLVGRADELNSPSE